MLHISPDGSISLTRGDTARLTVPITNDLTGEEYTLLENDVLTMSVKRSSTDDDLCFQKVLTGSNMFTIKPEDTRDLIYGKYEYDVQLTTAEGDIYTVVEPNIFEILPEVTW